MQEVWQYYYDRGNATCELLLYLDQVPGRLATLLVKGNSSF